jgi:hypothetical protein
MRYKTYTVNMPLAPRAGYCVTAGDLVPFPLKATDATPNPATDAEASALTKRIAPRRSMHDPR